MSMMSDYLKLLAFIRNQCQRFRDEPSAQKDILKTLKHSLPGKIYEPLRHIVQVKNWSEYMAGSTEIVTGHPYKIELSLDLYDPTNEIVNIDNQLWITDLYEGKLLGRRLETEPAGPLHYNGSTVRERFMRTLPGSKIETIMIPEHENTKTTEDLEVW